MISASKLLQLFGLGHGGHTINSSNPYGQQDDSTRDFGARWTWTKPAEGRIKLKYVGAKTFDHFYHEDEIAISSGRGKPPRAVHWFPGGAHTLLKSHAMGHIAEDPNAWVIVEELPPSPQPGGPAAALRKKLGRVRLW